MPTDRGCVNQLCDPVADSGGGGSANSVTRQAVSWVTGAPPIQIAYDLTALGYTTEALRINVNWILRNADGTYMAWFYGIGAAVKDQTAGPPAIWVPTPAFWPGSTIGVTAGPAPGALIQPMFSPDTVRLDFAPDPAAPNLSGNLIVEIFSDVP